METNTSKWPRALLVTGVVLGIVVIGLAGFTTSVVRRPFPKVNGEIEIAGLDGPVEVYRDDYGIPHIYAETEHDLYMAQGYVHAQDRFWQMEFWRHIGQGRLSEILGESTLSTDIFIRTIGWERAAQADLEALSPESVAMLQAYSDGVNAYINTHTLNEMGLEFLILQSTQHSWDIEESPVDLAGSAAAQEQPDMVNEYIEPWTPLNSITWAKAMAWDLGGNWESELNRVDLIQAVGADMAADLYPGYREGFPITIPGDATIASIDTTLVGNADREFFAAFGPGDLVGSNNWTVSGDMTTTGRPLLANDMHLGIQMPSIWYENALHCVEITPECQVDVSGFVFVSIPGVVAGHNDNIAWSFTNTGPDVQDLFIERVNPENTYQYEVNGEWVDMQVIREEITVKGQDEPVVLDVRVTRNGPILTDIRGFEDHEGYSVDDDGNPVITALSFRWTALEPDTIMDAFYGINRAENFDEFSAALEKWYAPSQNATYADVNGNIGLVIPGHWPIRANGDGTIPVPGWNDDYQWTGYIPYDEMPKAYNPPEGFIVTANNAMVGPDYPYFVTSEWASGYRAQRITDLIEAQQPISPERIAEIQGDNLSLSALEIMPFIADLSLKDADARAAQDILTSWDGQMGMDSGAAALWGVTWKNLMEATFNDELPQDLWPDGNSRLMAAYDNLLDEPDNPWWDNANTVQVETRDDILAQALGDAYAETVDLLGDNPDKWQWGDLHTATFENQSLGQSGIGLIESIFNRGPFAVSGGEAIVNATGWNTTVGFEVESLPSERVIYDVGAFDNTLATNTTGQSGHAFHPNYDNQIDNWRFIQFHPMPWTLEEVQAAAKDHLTLVPA